jgi:glycosyltransferase involved in cell wall biosynthesis
VRVAIVHYWFLLNGGGERVIDALAEMYPEADFFTLFADPDSIPESVKGRNLTTSFLNGFPFAQKLNRVLLPFYPAAVESFDLRNYDLVISSDSPPVKGLLLNQSAVHLCYCHTPARALWDSYWETRNNLPRFIRPFYSLGSQYVRMWDYFGAQRVDCFIANSNYVSRRIAKYYRRESTVIYPPVQTSNGYLSPVQDDYYLTVGRLVDTKRVDLLIHACNKLRRRFLIVGAGREANRLKSLAGPTIEFLGHVPETQLPELYARARAFLFAADEDFGIAPVEAQSYGRPVICLGHGGSLETVRGLGLASGPTGLYFQEQTVQSVCDAIQRFETVEDAFRPSLIQDHARQFDKELFKERMRQAVRGALATGYEITHSKSDLAFTRELTNLSPAIGNFSSQLMMTDDELNRTYGD